MTKLFNIRMDEGLIERLRAHSKQTGIPQSRLVRDALEGLLPKVTASTEPIVQTSTSEQELSAGTPSPPETSQKKRAAPHIDMEPAVEERRYFCPVLGCDYAPKSPAAVCPRHARKVRPIDTLPS